MLENMNYDPTEALSRIDNDKPLLAMLIGVFIKEIPAYTGKLESAASAQDWVALGDAAHNVKGASAAIGFEAARTLAEHLEKACRGNIEQSNEQRVFNSRQLIDVLETGQATLKAWAANSI